MFLTPSSFQNGFYKIGSNCFSEDDLQDYIDRFEKSYLIDLLGCELYNLFVSDLDGSTPPVPLTQRFIDIYDPICIDDTSVCNKTLKSDGIIEMLKGFVYFHYVRDFKFKPTVTGVVINTNEVSREAEAFEISNGVAERWNEAVKSYSSIRDYIIIKRSVYPEFNGVKIGYLYFGGAI